MNLYIVNDPEVVTDEVKIGFFLRQCGNEINLMARDNKNSGTFYVATISENGMVLLDGLPKEWSCTNKRYHNQMNIIKE